ncbi:hypothetical protein yc1106_06764 [Curvularia clavata]|uniref:Uncharacterized protein n=1 Tax=Curvularia clavata TaxID=95742 RepID=A0A9Q8ZD21_CURCL|nr:hypothetical protein yc1106_06764 [Curvularia clavata]
MAQWSDIPAELRNSIYNALLSRSQIPSEQFNSSEALSLFSVSKQLHNEASSYFYQHNEICIDTPSPITESATILPPVADRYVRFLRRLRVRATIGCTDAIIHSRIASTIWSLASTEAKLDNVHISIQSSLSRLISSRVDDSVLDHNNPITIALRNLLGRRVAKTVRVHLRGVWFTPFVIFGLESQYRDCLLFVDENGSPLDTSFVQRDPTGVYAATHIIGLGLAKEVTADLPSSDYMSAPAVPSSIATSVGSAFADLDTFSVSDFERQSDDARSDDPKEEPMPGDSFFSGADIEEWEAMTQDFDQHQSDPSGPEDMDMGCNFDDAMDEEDVELEDVTQEDFEAILGNMDDVAHHMANEADITYMTNFAPELLLSRHQLDHLM